MNPVLVVLLFPLLLFVESRVHNFTHEGFNRTHLVQLNFEQQRAKSEERGERQKLDTVAVAASKEQGQTQPSAAPDGHSEGHGAFTKDEGIEWRSGRGRIVERNPSPGMLQSFGEGLDKWTKGMANRMGWNGKEKSAVQSGEGVGRVSDSTTSSQEGFLQRLKTAFHRGDMSSQGREFCRFFPDNDKCRSGGTPAWADLREVVRKMEERVKASLPVIPRLSLRDPLQFVPESMRNAVVYLKQKWGELSAAAREMMNDVCRSGRINCTAQSEKAMQMRDALKEKLRQFRRFFGNGNDAELEEQFERTQQLKKALMARAGIDENVNPADDGVFDSDMLLTAKQSELLLNELGQGGKQTVEATPEAPTKAKSRRAALYFENQFFQKWDVSTPIPYTFDPSVARWEQTDVRDALSEIQQKTCIRFEEMKSRPSGYYINYVKIDSPTFCGLSYIGRTAPANPIYLSFACGEGRGIALHETLHALGLAHEHVRMDRDQHITVDWSNIDPRYYDAFAVSDPKSFSTYGVPYDYSSIMHYRANSAAINTNKNTMTPKVDPSRNTPLLGQRKQMSEKDVLTLNRLYCKPDSCEDSNVYCGAWALQGVCSRAANNVWMSANCRKSCALC